MGIDVVECEFEVELKHTCDCVCACMLFANLQIWMTNSQRIRIACFFMSGKLEWVDWEAKITQVHNSQNFEYINLASDCIQEAMLLCLC